MKKLYVLDVKFICLLDCINATCHSCAKRSTLKNNVTQIIVLQQFAPLANKMEGSKYSPPAGKSEQFSIA